MSNLHQWIIVVQILLTSGRGLCGDDDREHVHIKVHIPEVHRKHTHFRKVQKHFFHPKKIVKAPELLEAELDTTPFGMVSYGMSGHGQTFQFPSVHMNLPDMPYGVDNTLEATVMKKSKLNSIPSSMFSEGLISKFHGIKKPSEFLSAHPTEEIHKFTSPSDEDVSDDYDTRSEEAVVIDQRVAGSTYPYMPMSSSFKAKWPTYSNIFETSVKPYGGMRLSPSIPAEWLNPTTEEDFTAFDRFVSPTTMHIAKAKPLPSSRMKAEKHPYEREHYGESVTTSKKREKNSKTEKRHRVASSAFRINY